METFWIVRFLSNEPEPVCKKTNNTVRGAISMANDYALIKQHEAIFVIAPDRNYQVVHKI